MNHRGSANSSESLELLLDTICNTFGAVIFISLLVALLVSQGNKGAAVEAPQHDSAVDAAAVQAEVEAAKERVRVLSVQWRQQELITDKFANTESLALAQTIKQQTDARVTLVEEKSQAVQKVAETQTEIAVTQQDLETAQAEFDKVAAEQIRLQNELASQKQLSGRTARIPQVRKTDKESMVYAIDDGRLYRVTTPDQMIDTNDCERVQDNGSETIRPRTSAGGQIADGKATAAARKRLQGVRADRHFVQLFIARDSFAEFLPVKDLLVELGLEYEVRIMEGDTVDLVIGPFVRESFVQ